jgi:hypothetical protein
MAATSKLDRRPMPAETIPLDCFPTRISRAGRHVDRGEWASGHAILTGLRDCAQRGGCRAGDNCAAAAEMLLCDIRGLLDDRKGASPPQS